MAIERSKYIQRLIFEPSAPYNGTYSIYNNVYNNDYDIDHTNAKFIKNFLIDTSLLFRIQSTQTRLEYAKLTYHLSNHKQIVIIAKSDTDMTINHDTIILHKNNIINIRSTSDVFIKSKVPVIYYVTKNNLIEYKINNSTLFKNLVSSHIIQYPLKKYMHSYNDILTMFDNLKRDDYKKRLVHQEYDIDAVKLDDYRFENEYICLNVFDTDYNDFTMLSDFFNEQCRVSCVLHGYPSSISYFYRNPEKIATKTLDKYHVITPYNVRETLYRTIAECTSFRPNLIKNVIDMFGSKTVLDPCMGWGDRLIGAIAAGVDYYYGTDPNSCLHPAYHDIINMLDYDGKHKYKPIQSPFETADVISPKGGFDLVFTSPPYFDLEIYSREKTQSITRGNWFDDFLVVISLKAMSYLRTNGYFVYVISQVKGQHYVEDIIAFLSKHMKFMGTICYNMKNPQPMFIWKKV